MTSQGPFEKSKNYDLNTFRKEHRGKRLYDTQSKTISQTFDASGLNTELTISKADLKNTSVINELNQYDAHQQILSQLLVNPKTSRNGAKSHILSFASPRMVKKSHRMKKSDFSRILINHTSFDSSKEN